MMPKKLYPTNNSCILFVECMEKVKYRKNRHGFLAHLAQFLAHFI